MRKFSFEDMHPNHKWAFLDGFLCGLVAAWCSYEFYRDYREMRSLELKCCHKHEPKPDNTTD